MITFNKLAKKKASDTVKKEPSVTNQPKSPKFPKNKRSGSEAMLETGSQGKLAPLPDAEDFSGIELSDEESFR